MVAAAKGIVEYRGWRNIEGDRTQPEHETEDRRDEEFAGDYFEIMFFHGNWNFLPHLVDFPLASDPGTKFHYSNLTSHLLGVIVPRACRQDLETYARQYLFSPMDAELNVGARVATCHDVSDGEGLLLGLEVVSLRIGLPSRELGGIMRLPGNQNKVSQKRCHEGSTQAGAMSSMRKAKKSVTQSPGLLVLVLLVLLLGSTACRSEEGPGPTTVPTAHQPETKDQGAVATGTPVSPSATPVPPAPTLSPVMSSTMQATSPSTLTPAASPSATATPFPRLSGSGGGVIAFQSDRDRQDEIYVMNADGSDQRLLIANQWALDSMPAWSPDGRQIALASRERGKDFEICVVSVTDDLQAIEGETSTQLTDNDYDDLHPTWSADGTQIAFFSKRDGNTDIFVMNADGTGERQLTDNSANDEEPAWSPDGTQIAFISRRDGDYEIYVTKPDGTDARPLTGNDTNEWSPAWSPDGRQIAFVSDRNGERHLFVMDADGSNPRQLTDASSPWNGDPAWSPDGTQIAFRSNRDGYVDVYVINVDGGSRPLQLTHNTESDQDRAPSWRPTGTASDPAR